MDSLKRKFPGVIVVLVVTVFLGWLWSNEKAAEPGSRSRFHEEFSPCETCHIPWRGVRDDQCLECHSFADVSALRPQLRFHEAEKWCLRCHTEHKGLYASISRIDHALLHEELLCTQCHLDPHEGLFGEECRECHWISTWRIQGYRHPPWRDGDCHRCHKAPRSHGDPSFWTRILEGHAPDRIDRARVSPDQCWACHTIQNWRHLMMDHLLTD